MGLGIDLQRCFAARQITPWVIGGISAVLVCIAMFLYGFLAENDPVGEGVLVVEAWIPEQALAESANVFNSGGYRCLVVVGGTTQENGESNRTTTDADLAASKLEKLGLDTKKLATISVPDESPGRTLGRATAVKRWLGSSETSVCCVDVFTVGVHARKSRILFRHALGDRYRVGIIAGHEVRYDPRFWLVSRTGVWIVVRNLAGYVYSKLWVLFKAALGHMR
jgi:hypothetical protein